MKIEDTLIRQVKITDVQGLDPIRVMIEEYDRGQAKVIIECYGQSWSSYWGSMGGDLVEFFTRTNVDYLSNCFDRGLRNRDLEVDTSAMLDQFKKAMRESILDRRKDGCIDKDDAATLWEQCNNLDQHDLDEMRPDHQYDNWKIQDTHYMCETTWKRFFGSFEDDLSCWVDDHVTEVYLPNHAWDYLTKIVSVVKVAITGIEED